MHSVHPTIAGLAGRRTSLRCIVAALAITAVAIVALAMATPAANAGHANYCGHGVSGTHWHWATRLDSHFNALGNGWDRYGRRVHYHQYNVHDHNSGVGGHAYKGQFTKQCGTTHHGY